MHTMRTAGLAAAVSQFSSAAMLSALPEVLKEKFEDMDQLPGLAQESVLKILIDVYPYRSYDSR